MEITDVGASKFPPDPWNSNRKDKNVNPAANNAVR